MPIYQKKPIKIEAVQYLGFTAPNFTDYPVWLLKAIESKVITKTRKGLFVHSLEGLMKVSKGDYIIKGINGEIYPCKPDIFEKTYEVIE